MDFFDITPQTKTLTVWRSALDCSPRPRTRLRFLVTHKRGLGTMRTGRRYFKEVCDWPQLKMLGPLDPFLHRRCMSEISLQNAFYHHTTGVGIGGGHDGLELFQYFSASCYDGYGDSDTVCIHSQLDNVTNVIDGKSTLSSIRRAARLSLSWN